MDKHEGNRYFQADWLNSAYCLLLPFHITDSKNPCIFPRLNKTSEKEHFIALVTKLEASRFPHKLLICINGDLQPNKLAFFFPWWNCRFHRNKAEFQVHLCTQIIASYTCDNKKEENKTPKSLGSLVNT